MSKDTLNHHIHTFPSPYFLLNHQEHGFGVIEGTARANSSLLLEVTENRIVVADTERKELLRVNEIIGEPLQRGTVLDRNGNSFEGCVNHNEPFGWGVLYDKDHNRMYEGFRIGESSSCFGTSFDPENHHVQYEGEYCNGKRWGRGTQYDKMGKVVFDGEWLNDERLERRVKIASHDDLFHTQIEELTIANGACNEDDWKTLDLTALSLLRRLVIGEDCFDKVKEVKIVGLAQLEEVTIGKNCFLNGRSWAPRAHVVCTEGLPQGEDADRPGIRLLFVRAMRAGDPSLIGGDRCWWLLFPVLRRGARRPTWLR